MASVQPPAFPLVTLGLSDGTEMTGRMTEAFSPYVTHITLDPTVDLDSPSLVHARVTVNTTSLAFVGMIRAQGERPPPVAPAGRVRVRVDLGPRAILVAAPPPNRWTKVGFFAAPLELSSPFRELYFYLHAFVPPRDDEIPGAGAELVLSTKSAPVGASSSTTPRARPIDTGEIDPPTPNEPDAALRQKRRHMRLGELLMSAGLVPEADVARASFEQRKRPGTRIGAILVEMGVLDEKTLTSVLAEKFQLPFVDLDKYSIPNAAAHAVPVPAMLRHRLLPIHADARGITVAISDPFAMDAADALRLQLGKPVTAVLVVPSQLEFHLKRITAPPQARGSQSSNDEFDSIVKSLVETDELDGSRLRSNIVYGESETGVIRLVSRLIHDAYVRGASDIHIEPGDDNESTRVRLRIDGDCVPYHEVPSSLAAPIAARIKVMANLDIAEHRKPQDGKLRHHEGEAVVELRVATLPTVNGGENVVLRILPPATPRPLNEMSLSDRNLRELKRLLAMPYGLILSVGPTGSGKTTTIHSCLAELNTPDMKIWTIEDPIEITQRGLCQVQVHPKIGLDFATAMRSFLRADPDVIMVGEMRDIETASVAIEASLTGHLVLSTLHTNTAPETVTRLIDMGLEPFSFADSLLGVLAQRLVRKLCAYCTERRPMTRVEFERIVAAYGDEETLAESLGVTFAGEPTTAHARGCEHCAGTGYRGRTAIHELFVADDATRQAIARRASSDELRTMASLRGMRTLLQDGVGKVLRGVTDLRSVLAVCSR